MTFRSKLFRNCVAILLALAMSVPVLQMLGPTESAEAVGTTSTLRIGFLEKVDSLNPYIGVTDAAYVFYGLVYDALTCVDNKLNVSPNLALSTWPVPVSDPEMVSLGLPYGSLWQYNLTENATWSDGEPFTADDVVWNININADNYANLWAFQPYTYFVDHAEKVDSRTVRILFYDRSTGDPCPAAYGYSLSMFMLPKHKLVSFTAFELGFTWIGLFTNETPRLVGTGPFIPTDTIYSDWLMGNPITLVKNPNYHFGPDHGKYVNFDQVQLVFFDEVVAMTYALRNNQLDIAQFPAGPYHQLKRDVESGAIHNIQTYDGPRATQYWTEIGICDGSGGSNPSRTDPVIKHALAQATNKTYITDNFYLGFSTPGSTMIAPMNSYWHYEPGVGEKWVYDLAAAAALLESSGYIDTDSDGIREATITSPAVQNGLVPEGTKLSYQMLVRVEYPEEKDIALWLRSEWANIGVDINIIVVDEPTLNTIVYSYSYDMMIWFWSSDVDPNYQLFMTSTMAIYGWNDIAYSNPAYDENYTNSVKAMDRDQRKVYVDNCQRIMYQDANYIILAYPYQTYAWRTDTFVGWGDWAANPGRSMDNYWTANPLLFDLVPRFNETGPTNLSLTAQPEQAAINSEVTFEASADAPAGLALRFTLDFGDGTVEVFDTPITSGSWTELFTHSYGASSVYNATLWVWDGLDGPFHNVSTSAFVTVMPGPQRTVQYQWYDMFNVPFGSWWDRRWALTLIEQPWSTSYPYIFKWHGAPLGNNLLYTNMRLNITASSLPEINMNSQPEFLPLLGAERGGNAEIDWHMQYMTHDEILARFPPSAAGWDDGWFLRLNGTTTLDEQGAKSVLGLTDLGYDNFTAWWPVNNVTKSQEYFDWLEAEGNSRLDIYPMYEYPLTFLDWTFWAEKVGTSIVLHYDYVTWGMEALMTRWMHEAFMPTEWYFEGFNMHAEIGPSLADLDVDTVVVYAAFAWENRTSGEPCWVWEGMLQDYVQSYVIHPRSAFDQYVGMQYMNRGPGSAWHGSMMDYDYTPAAWNLSQGETLSFQWPAGPQMYIRHVGYDATSNETGNMSVGYSEPWITDFPTKVVMNPGARTITFTGPIDMWNWSKNQTAHQDLANEWNRLPVLPYGIPWLEFQNVSRAGPNAAFNVTPATGNTSTAFMFDASATTDPDNPSGTLEFRWDFESDGVWDTGWSSSPVTTHAYSRDGAATAMLQVRNDLGQMSSAVGNVYVVGSPPEARFTVHMLTGVNMTMYAVDASPSSDAEDPISALMVRWRWDYGGLWTPWTTEKTATHVYSDLGNHTITLQVMDTSGAVSFATAKVSVNDSECPVTSISVQGTVGGGGWYTTDATFEFLADDNQSYVDATYYRIDGGPWLEFNGTPCGAPEGGHVVEYYSVDAYGNNESVKLAFIDVDTEAPWIHGSIASGTLGLGGWYVTRPTIDLGAVDDDSSGVAQVRYLVFGVQWTVYAGPFQLRDTGTLMMQIEATDNAGNQMPAKQVVVKVDPFAPIVTVGSQASYDSSSVTINWGVSENVSGLSKIETSIDGGSFANQALGSSQTFTGLTDGTHTLIVRAIDAAGNVGEKTVTFTVDTSATTPGGTSALTYALIGVAVVAAVAAVLILLMRRKWKPISPQPP